MMVRMLLRLLRAIVRFPGRLLHWLLYGPETPDPTTFPEAIAVVRILRLAVMWLTRAVAILCIGLPLCAYIAVTIGERGRAALCDDVEDALLGYNNRLVARMVQASVQPTTPEEQQQFDRAVTILTDDLGGDIRMLMQECEA
jgi:hypothetical protein